MSRNAGPGSLEFREFTRSDWEVYSGAEMLDGSQPFVAEIEVDGHGGDVIIDASGVSVHWWVDDKAYFAGPVAHWMVVKMRAVMSASGLAGLGFYIHQL